MTAAKLRASAFIASLSLVAMLLSAPSLGAQAPSVVGTVLIDSSEKPLANAEIRLIDLKRSTRREAGRV